MEQPDCLAISLKKMNEKGGTTLTNWFLCAHARVCVCVLAGAWEKEEKSFYLDCVVFTFLPDVAHRHHAKGQVGETQLFVFAQKVGAQQWHLCSSYRTYHIWTMSQYQTVNSYQFVANATFYLVDTGTQLMTVHKFWDTQGNI